jgi:hypothetical protein
MPMGAQQQPHDPNVNSILANTESSSTALQNMQLMLLKQQQQQGLANRSGMHHPEPHNMRPSMLSGIPTAFNSSQQFSKSASPINASVNNNNNNAIGTSGVNGGGTGNNPSPQPMFMFQQQLSALQKQQMSGVGGGSGSSSSSSNSSAMANAAMVAMNNNMQQQLAADGGNNMYAPQLPNATSAVSSNLPPGMMQQQSQQLQARHQQLMQQMQQQQHHLNRSVSDTATIDGNNNTLFNMPNKQQPGSMLRNISSASTGMYNMMNQMSQPGSGMEQMQLQNSGTGSALSMMNANNFGMMGGHNMNNNNTSNMLSSTTDLGPMKGNNTNPPVSMDGSSNRMMSSDQTAFLDGRFAGGWQSNADLPERRNIIFRILDVIRQMRPDTSKLSNKYVRSKFQNVFYFVNTVHTCFSSDPSFAYFLGYRTWQRV